MLSFPRKFLLRLSVCPHTPSHVHIHTNPGFASSVPGQIQPRNQGDVLNAQPQTAELKIPKCLHLGPECRGRRPVAHNSHGVFKPLKSVSCLLSRFLLDSLKCFPGLHWKETSIMVMSDTSRNRRAHRSLQPIFVRRRRDISCHRLIPCVWSLPPYHVRHISSEDILWKVIVSRKNHQSVDLWELTHVWSWASAGWRKTLVWHWSGKLWE